MLPERIHATRTITYVVSDIVDSLKEFNDDPDYTPTIQDVIEYVDDWLYDDFGDNSGVRLQDENGNEL
jgi:hypothetical protein